MYANRLRGGKVFVRLRRFKRVHMLRGHEPARLIGAHGQEREVEQFAVGRHS